MSEMTLGACLVANEPDGLTKALIDARVQGKSWKTIADEFGYANPGAARTAFKKATGISDFKVKGPKVKEMFDALQSGKGVADETVDLAKQAAKVVAPDPATAKQLKYIDDLIKKLDLGDNYLKFDPKTLSKKEASELIDQLKKIKHKPANKTQAISKLKEAYKKANGIEPSDGLESQWDSLPDKDVEELTVFYEEKAIKNASSQPVAASPTGKAASNALKAEDWVPEVEPKPMYLFDKDVVADLNAGKTYKQIQDKFALSFDEIDEINWNRLLHETNGDVWKAFKEKPTSQRAETAVKKLFADAQQHGVSATDFKNLTGIDSGTYDALKAGTWTKSPPGSYSYTPPASASSQQSYIPSGSYSTPQYSSGTQQVGNTTPNFPKGSHQELLDWNRSLGKMDDDVFEAVRDYTGSSYQYINTTLRQMESHRSTRYIDQAFKPIPNDIHVVRGTGRSVLQGRNPEEMVGTVFVDHGYMSTSVGSGFGGQVNFIIDVPAGTPARYVDEFSRHSGERELLLPRETKFMVEGVSKSGSTTTIYMRVIGHGITG